MPRAKGRVQEVLMGSVVFPTPKKYWLRSRCRWWPRRTYHACTHHFRRHTLPREPPGKAIAVAFYTVRGDLFAYRCGIITLGIVAATVWASLRRH